MEIKILVNAYCPTVFDADELSERFYNNYWYFAEEFYEVEYSYSESTKMVHFIWAGKTDELSDEDRDDLIRLTHHAEALYEDSNIEHTHVEVCIDGKWYGRQIE